MGLMYSAAKRAHGYGQLYFNIHGNCVTLHVLCALDNYIHVHVASAYIAMVTIRCVDAYLLYLQVGEFW